MVACALLEDVRQRLVQKPCDQLQTRHVHASLQASDATASGFVWLASPSASPSPAWRWQRRGCSYLRCMDHVAAATPFSESRARLALAHHNKAFGAPAEECEEGKGHEASLHHCSVHCSPACCNPPAQVRPSHRGPKRMKKRGQGMLFS